MFAKHSENNTEADNEADILQVWEHPLNKFNLSQSSHI